MKKLLVLSFFTLYFSLFTFLFAQTGTWSAVKNKAPHRNYGVCLLMTDGTVICHNDNGGDYGTGWDRLTPDIHGSYANGTWDTIRSMRNGRLFFSTQVLPSGNVYVSGGGIVIGVFSFLLPKGHPNGVFRCLFELPSALADGKKPAQRYWL